MPTKRYRVMVNIPTKWEDAVKARAALAHRPVANYIEALVVTHLEQRGAPTAKEFMGGGTPEFPASTHKDVIPVEPKPEVHTGQKPRRKRKSA